MGKPLVFIGSSREGLPLAKIVADLVKVDLEPKLWSEGLFRPGSYTLEALGTAARECKFALIVGTPDDDLTRRGTQSKTVRDNLVFELGMFAGTFGRRRALLAVPRGAGLALPTDLLGLTLIEYAPFTVMPSVTPEMLVSANKVADDAKSALGAEWNRMRLAAEARRKKREASLRFKAIRRLVEAIVQLHYLMVEIPTKAITNLGSKSDFDSVKTEAQDRVKKLYEQWRKDAELVGALREFEALTLATSQAISAFPHPREVAPTGEDAGRAAVDVLRKTAAAVRQGEDFVDAFGSEAASQFKAHAGSFGGAYSKWWSRHSTEVARCTTELQTALMLAALDLGEDVAA